MGEMSGDAWRLFVIKSHIDSHGIGCALMGDHVVVEIEGEDQGPDKPREKLRRVKSLDEARRAIRCHCAEGE